MKGTRDEILSETKIISNNNNNNSEVCQIFEHVMQHADPSDKASQV